jgi:hypothetical protein
VTKRLIRGAGALVSMRRKRDVARRAKDERPVPSLYPFVDSRRYHVTVEGRYTARSVLPSPSKSSAIGMSPGRPHPYETQLA